MIECDDDETTIRDWETPEDININYVSDLHLEFSEVMPEQANKVLKGGDVLVLAGDVFPLKWLPKAKHLKHFLDTASERYQRVYAVAGNHEAYGRDLIDLDTLGGFYAEHGVTYLDDTYDDFGGLRFFGGVLWPDMNNGCPLTQETVRSYLNDYRVIRGMSPNEAMRRHRATLYALHQCRPDVVISHMAPNRGSVHPRFEREGRANYGYFSDVDIPEYVRLWIHGHVHDPFDYTVGRTRIVCNPRGYPAETARNRFNWNRTVTLQALEKVFDKRDSYLYLSRIADKQKGVHMNLYTADFATALATASKIDDIDAAVLIIMDILGVTSGDNASMFFTGDDDDELWPEKTPAERLSMLTRYAIGECIGVLRHAEANADDMLGSGR